MEFLTGHILGYMLILTRIGAFFASSPLFSWQAIPNRSKVTIALVLAYFFSSITPAQFDRESLGFVEVLLLNINEALYGLALGFVAYCLFAVVRIAGRFIERQMGLTMANTMDPFSGEQGQPLGMLLEMMFFLILFQTNGHHLLIKIMHNSFIAFSPGAAPLAKPLTESVLLAGSGMLLLALQMAAPLLAIFLMVMIVLAFMARIAPEANVMFLSMPLRVGLGLLIVGSFIPFLVNYINTLTEWLDKLLPI